MTLVIDTASFNEAVVALKGRNGEIAAKLEFEAGRKLSDKLLPQIEKLLGEGARQGRAVTGQVREVGLQNLTAVEVNLGPGSFTGLRIGAAVANALGYALNIPVNSQKMVIPQYGKEPNITIPK